MIERKLTIAQLADEVNKQVSDIKSSDARYSSIVSVRRIQDYITKGLLDKPFGSGHNKWYGQGHLDKLLAIRTLQLDGLSDQSILKITTEQNLPKEDQYDQLQKSALSLLSNISTGSVGVASGAIRSTSSSETLANYYNSTDSSKLQSLNNLNKQVSKTWNEYQLDNEGKVFLRMQGAMQVKNGEEILNQIKLILNTGDTK